MWFDDCLLLKSWYPDHVMLMFAFSASSSLVHSNWIFTSSECISRNILVCRFPETDGESTNWAVEQAGEEPQHKSVRVGMKKSTDSQTESHRPIRFSSSSHVIKILQHGNWRTLKDIVVLTLCSDRSPEERKLRIEAAVCLRENFKSEPNKRHFIRDGKFVSVQAGKNPLG